MQFRVVTYNIHKGIGGVDRRCRPERIVATLPLICPSWSIFSWQATLTACSEAAVCDRSPKWVERAAI